MFGSLTPIEALDKELERLDVQMDQFSFDETTLPEHPTVKMYNDLALQRQEIQKALVELAKTASQPPKKY